MRLGVGGPDANGLLIASDRLLELTLAFESIARVVGCFREAGLELQSLAKTADRLIELVLLFKALPMLL